MKLQINYEKLKKEAIIRSIKMLDIGILTTIYFILGYFISWGVNKIYYDFNPNEHRNKIVIFLEICMQIFVIGVLIYIIRNIVQFIPFPLEGFYGYQHSRVKELSSGGIAISFGVFYAQENIKQKLNYVLDG